MLGGVLARIQAMDREQLGRPVLESQQAVNVQLPVCASRCPSAR